ncbi:AI-2E family transporter [Apilactobacillus ozensis]|uniref:AI-2E family transporter n=1 Tax=Apilactobacillus ozensis TaxID=866801 RepID=UPI0006D0F902|nr:AI-2E family transporter [Apilactobacillus ozensis]
MDKLKKSPIIFWSLEILIVVSIIFVCTKISFVFSPIGIFVSTVFAPILIAGVLFYMLNPIVNLLVKIKIKRFKITRTLATVIVFLFLLGILVYLISSFLPRLINQVSNLVYNIPSLAKTTTKSVNSYSHSGILKNAYISDYIDKLQSSAYTYAQNSLGSITSSVGQIISMATSFVILLITVPVILFYMLKDGYKLLPSIKKVLPPKHRDQTIDLITKMSQTISKYIGGQMIECLFVGTFTSLGYFLIGQNYALLLGVFAGICNIIPYVGPYIGIVPAVFVSLSDSWIKLLYVIIVVLIVQQLDGNLVYPNVIGKSLQIHPLTIIIILLAAGNIAGLLGMILAIPLYAVVKVVVQYIYNIWLLQKKRKRIKYKIIRLT